MASFLLPGHAGQLKRAPSESPQLYAHDRDSEQERLRAALPNGTRMEVAKSLLDSLGIANAAVVDSPLVVRALIRETSRSAVTVGNLEVMLYFTTDSALSRLQFKKVYIAP